MIYLLLVIYQLKHFVADYPLQGRYMLGKFKPFPDCLLPLLSHGLVHGVFTFLIALYFKDAQTSLMLGLLDMAVHSGVDYIKANPSIGGRFSALSKKEMITEVLPNLSAPEGSEPRYSAEYRLKSNTFFWWALGADQLAHHLTHYVLIYLILS